MTFLAVILLIFIRSSFAGEDLLNTALIIGAGDAGRGDSVEFWPQIGQSTCQQIDNLPFPRFGHSGALMGNLVYACGGSDYPECLDDCYVVDVTVGGGWQQVASMSQDKSEFSLVSMGDYLLSIGGYTQSGYLDTIEIFDGESWQVADFSLLSARYAHCSVKINDEEVMVLGGGGYDARRLSSVEIIRIEDGTSTMFESMTRTRMYFGCTFSQDENRVYVSGGWGTSSLVEYLDLATWQWKRIGNLNTGRSSHQMGIIGGKLTVFGGSVQVGHDSVYINNVEQYDANKDIWEEVEPMQAARSNMAMVEISC